MTSHEEIFGKRTESGEVDLVAAKGANKVTLEQDIDQKLINFMCQRFEQCDCLEALETCLVPLQKDIADKADYTLVDGALDKMRAAYKKRSDELKGK